MNTVRTSTKSRKYNKVSNRNHRAEECNTELKYTLESSTDEAEERISKLEHRAWEFTQAELQKEKRIF